MDLCVSYNSHSKEALSTGQAMAMAVWRRPLNLETEFRSRSNPLVICSKESGDVKRFRGFLQVFFFSPIIILGPRWHSG